MEEKGTGLDIAVRGHQALNADITHTRHVALQEAEVATEEDTKLLTQVQRQSPNIQWLIGPVRKSTDGT